MNNLNPYISQIGTNTGFTSPNITITFPSTLKAGEGLLIFISGRNNDSGLVDPPTLIGFTMLSEFSGWNTDDATSSAVYYKIATSTDVSNGNISVGWSSGEVQGFQGTAISIGNAPAVSRIQSVAMTGTTSPFSSTGFSTMYANSLLFGLVSFYRGLTGNQYYATDISLETDDVTFTENSRLYDGAYTRAAIWSASRSSANGTGDVTWTYNVSSSYSSNHFVAIAPIDPIISTTQAVSSITSTTAVGNGNLTSIGAENAYQRGMAYTQSSSGDIEFIGLNNPSFENTSLLWTGSGTLAKSTTQYKYGSNSMKVTWVSGTEAYGEQKFTSSTLRNKYVTFGAWVWSDTANTACLNLSDTGFNSSQSSFHSGNSTWEWLTTTLLVNSAMTELKVRCRIAATSSTPNCYFDGTIAGYSSTTYPTFTFSDGNYSTGAFTTNLTGLTRNLPYRVASFASNQYGSYYGSTVGFSTIAELPTVTTTSVNSISQTGAIVLGNLTDTGGETPSEIGFCWNTTTDPVITDDKIVVYTGLGAYNGLISGLTANTTYYVRAYATNTIGTSYGANVTFSTISSGPMIKRRISFLSKAQSLTIELSNNSVDETFTILQFAVNGEKQEKKTFSPDAIVSIN